MAKLRATNGAADLWDSALAGWNETRPAAFLRAYSDAVNELLLAEWLRPGRARRLLKTDLFDEAVGSGLVASLELHAAEVVAIDVSPAVVELARSRHPGLDARVADTRALPFEEGAFDVVLSNSTLDHFESLADLRAALAELRRVLEPGGRLVLTLDNGANPLVLLRNALPEFLLSRLRLVPYPIGVTCGPRRLRGVLREAGFEVEASRGVMHCPRVLARAASALAPRASRGLLKGAMAFEGLGRLPTRYLTAQFVAASARAASEPATAPGARRWTLRSALARAIEVLRAEGVRALVARAASETVYRRLVLVERGLREPLDVAVPAELAFGYLDERGLDTYDELRPGRRRDAAERLAAGHRCFATWLDGRLVAVRWLATGAPHVEYLDLPLELADGDVYHYDTFTDAAVRRRGISAASQARLFATLRDEGFERSVRAVLPENRAAVADAARAGFRLMGRVGYVKLGPWRRTFRTRRTR